MPDERITSHPPAVPPAPTSPAIPSPLTEPAWFVLSHGREAGPFTTEELQAKAAAGAVGPEDLVRNQRCPWTPAGQWAFLADHLPNTSSPATAAQAAATAGSTASRQRWVWPAAAGAFALAFVGVLGLLSSQGTPPMSSGQRPAAAAPDPQPVHGDDAGRIALEDWLRGGRAGGPLRQRGFAASQAWPPRTWCATQVSRLRMWMPVWPN